MVISKSSKEALKEAILNTIDAQKLDPLAYLFGRWSQIQGFKCSWKIVPEKLMLCVTELSEAMEAFRHGDMENFNEEIADTFIRLLDMCGRLQIPLQESVRNKMIKNFDRPRKHHKSC